MPRDEPAKPSCGFGFLRNALPILFKVKSGSSLHYRELLVRIAF
jgi:hypothetical protein